jgi:hypothetical protein
VNVALALLLLASGLTDDPAFQEGLRLYRDVEFEQALFRFQEAATAPGRPDEDKVVLFQWLGMTYAALERVEASDRAFRDALRLDPRAALPPDAAPKLRERYEELRAEVKAELIKEEQPAPPPQPPDSQPEPEPAGAPAEGGIGMTPLLFASAGVAGAAAVLAGAAGGLVIALATQTVAVAEDPEEFQDERIAALERANTQLGIGYGLFAAGGAMIVVAGGLGGAAVFVE